MGKCEEDAETHIDSSALAIECQRNNVTVAGEDTDILLILL